MLSMAILKSFSGFEDPYIFNYVVLITRRTNFCGKNLNDDVDESNDGMPCVLCVMMLNDLQAGVR